VSFAPVVVVPKKSTATTPETVVPLTGLTKLPVAARVETATSSVVEADTGIAESTGIATMLNNSVQATILDNFIILHLND
jgi:hypothetical protein